MTPKNKMYLTSQDFEQWSDYFGALIASDKRYDNKSCRSDCSSCSSSCSTKYSENSDIRTKNVTFVVTEACNLNCSYCLPKGTKVLTDTFGYKNIEDIEKGDKLLGFEEYPTTVQRKILPTKVIETYRHAGDVIRITFEDNTYLDITKNHPILTIYGKDDWQEAGRYKIGQQVKCFSNPNITNVDYNQCLMDTKLIKNIEELGEQEVFNIATESRTYFANDIAVHNCYETHKTGRRMTKEVAKQSVDFLFDEQKINGYYDFSESVAVVLEFIGGEPLLEIDLIDYIVEYFKFKAFEVGSPWSSNYMISMSSNGVLFETKEVQDFIKRNLGRVSIGITIDGNKELHDKCRVFHDGTGSYDVVESSVKAWLKINPNAQTKITLAPENVMYLNDALKNVWSLGLKGAFTNCVFEEGWKTSDATILYHQMIELADYLLENENYTKYFCSLFDETIGKKNTEDRNFCGGSGDMLAIAPDGKCFPCIRFMGYSLNGRKEQSIGDVYNGLDTKEDNEWLNELSKITMSSQCSHEDNKKCLDCPISSGCALCTGYNYDKFGDPNHKATFICEMHCARVLSNSYFFNKLYKKLGLEDRFKLNISKDWALKIITEEEYNKLILLGGE